jgi:hypothetical protein
LLSFYQAKEEANFDGVLKVHFSLFCAKKEELPSANYGIEAVGLTNGMQADLRWQR